MGPSWKHHFRRLNPGLCSEEQLLFLTTVAPQAVTLSHLRILTLASNGTHLYSKAAKNVYFLCKLQNHATVSMSLILSL